MSKQTITYNGFSFPFAKLNVTMATEYAEDRATQIGTAYEFQISGTIVGTSTTDMAAKVSGLRGMLQQPRKELSIQWDSDTFYDFKSTDDIRWGPLPGELQLQQFLGGKMAVYSWTVRVAVKDCQSCNGTTCNLQSRPSNVLAVTRYWDFSVDANGLTTATISGELVLSSQAQAAGITADNYRFLVALNLPKGFRRDSYDYNTSPDGTRLRYSIRDVEMALTYPRPITGGQVSWSVSVDQGLQVNYSLAGWYSAPRQIPKATILQKIADLVNDRFPINTDAALIFSGTSLSEEIFDNKISFQISGNSAVTQNQSPTKFSFTDKLATIGAAVTGSDGVSYIPGPYGGDVLNGDSGVIALPVSIWDPCSGAGSLTLNSQQGTVNSLGNPPGATGGGNDTAIQSLAGTPGTASQAHKDAPYYAFHEKISYEVDNHIVTWVPKVAGKNPIAQQTGIPTMTVIQAGYAIRDVPDDKVETDQPTPNPPVFTSDQAAMLHAYVAPVSGTQIGTLGVTRMRIEWRYVLRVLKSIEQGLGSIDNGDAELAYPDDPRVDGQSPSVALNPPNGGQSWSQDIVKQPETT